MSCLAIIDTSVLIPILDRLHTSHDKARDATNKHTIWHIPAGVVQELTQVVRRRMNARSGDGNTAARQALDGLESASAYRYLPGHDPEFVSRIYHAHPALSYVDAWGIAVALDRVEPLVTFDERQRAVWESLR